MAVIEVCNVGKSYRLYPKPHDRLLEAVFGKPRHSVFTALEEISFQVEKGGALGVIGDNGAGKSTLLKLLAGTVKPTTGTIEIHGRVAALLELGAGFHPEFTGRWNIRMNASLLGISEDEIRLKENEIIEFAELEKFIDRPVRTYSTGMYLRLAFSIATTIDPDILIVDEALSVGDLAFQHKCIRRMHGFRKQAKTMLFCSHSMYHVLELCDRAIWLENGKIRQAGPCDKIVAMYEDFCHKRRDSEVDVNHRQENHPTAEDLRYKDARIVGFRAVSQNGKNWDSACVNPHEPVILEMEVEILTNGANPNFGFAVVKDNEQVIGAGISFHDGVYGGPYKKGGRVRVRYFMDTIPLRYGGFTLIGAIADETGLLWHEIRQLGPFTAAAGTGMGMIPLKGSWEIVK